MKPRFKLVQSSHYGFYEWVLTHGTVEWQGEVCLPGQFFSCTKKVFWAEGFVP